jgi:hypothetical protein
MATEGHLSSITEEDYQGCKVSEHENLEVKFLFLDFQAGYLFP